MMRKALAVFVAAAFIGGISVVGVALAEKRPEQIGTFNVETMT